MVQLIDHVELFQFQLYVYDNMIKLHHLMFDVSLRLQVHDYDEKAKRFKINKKQVFCLSISVPDMQEYTYYDQQFVQHYRYYH